MKKKKFPVVWTAVLSIGLVVVFVINASGGSLDLSRLFMNQQRKEMQRQAMDDIKLDSVADTRAQMAAAAASQANAPDADPVARRGGGLPTEPVIFIPKRERHMEQPNDSSTSSHWYREEAKVNEIGEEVREKRSIN